MHTARAFVSVLCAWLRVATSAIVRARIYHVACAIIVRMLHARHPHRATRAHDVGTSRVARARRALRMQARPMRPRTVVRAPQFTYALRVPASSDSHRGGVSLGFRFGRTCCCIPNLEHMLFKRACTNCATSQVFSRARRQQLALHGRKSWNDKSMQSCSAGRCKMLPTRPSLHAAIARNGLGAEGRSQNY